MPVKMSKWENKRSFVEHCHWKAARTHLNLVIHSWKYLLNLNQIGLRYKKAVVLNDKFLSYFQNPKTKTIALVFQ